METKPLIFISSTSDMQAERSALANTLRPTFDPYLFEEDAAQSASPQERCREMIERANVFVSCLGTDYGSPHPDTSIERSITEWEYDTASTTNAAMFIFIAESTKHDADIAPPQRRFLEKVSSFQDGRWCKFFNSSQDLALLAMKAIAHWSVQLRIAAGPIREGKRRTVRIAGISLAIVVAAVTFLCHGIGLISTGVVSAAIMFSFASLAVVLVLEYLE